MGRTLDANDEQAHQTFTAAIDVRLRAFDSKHPVSVAVPAGVSDKVVDRIIREYGTGRGGGNWTVRRDKGDVYDGGWDNLVFS